MFSFLYSLNIIFIHMPPLLQTIVSISVHLKVQYGIETRPQFHIRLGTQFLYGLMCMCAWLHCHFTRRDIHMFSTIFSSLKATSRAPPLPFLQWKCLIMLCPIKGALERDYIMFSPVKRPLEVTPWHVLHWRSLSRANNHILPFEGYPRGHSIRLSN